MGAKDRGLSKFSFYLVCHEHIEEVYDFLIQFFPEMKGVYNYEHWITFDVPEANFHFDIMDGSNQELSKNVTFQMDAGSLEDLEILGKRYGCTIKDFLCDETDQKYRYYYIEVLGPHSICKMEISYCDNL